MHIKNMFMDMCHLVCRRGPIRRGQLMVCVSAGVRNTWISNTHQFCSDKWPGLGFRYHVPLKKTTHGPSVAH